MDFGCWGLGFGVYLARFEGSAVDGVGKNEDETHCDEPIGGDSIEEHANNGAKEEHVKSVTILMPGKNLMLGKGGGRYIGSSMHTAL